VKAVAKKVVTDALEDKYNKEEIAFGGLPVYFNAAISSTAECFPLLPKIAQGTDSHQRVGDRIRPKKFTVDVVICANGSYNSSSLNQVRLFILQDKSIKFTPDIRSIVATQPGTPIATQLIDYGSSVGGFQGIPNQIMMRVNKRKYTVFHDKVVEVLSGNGQTPQAINGYNGSQVFVSGQQCYKLRFTVPTPAVLKYSQLLDVYPSNFAPFMCLGYVQPDGNASPDNLLTRVACSWVSHLDYEDA